MEHYTFVILKGNDDKFNPNVAFHCYDCGFISAKTNDPDFGIEIDVVC